MKKILFVLLLLSSAVFAQKQQEPQKFDYMMYAETSMKGDTVLGKPTTYAYQSIVVFYKHSLDVFTFNWTETLVRESRITKHSYLCRTKSGEIAIVSFLKTKKPKQLVLGVMYGNKNYWFLKKIK